MVIKDGLNKIQLMMVLAAILHVVPWLRQRRRIDQWSQTQQPWSQTPSTGGARFHRGSQLLSL